MAHSISAQKRIRQNRTRRALNRWRKRRIHVAVKEFEATLHGGSRDDAQSAYVKVVSLLDKVAGQGAIHRNKAARKKSRLARRLHTHQPAAA